MSVGLVGSVYEDEIIGELDDVWREVVGYEDEEIIGGFDDVAREGEADISDSPKYNHRKRIFHLNTTPFVDEQREILPSSEEAATYRLPRANMRLQRDIRCIFMDINEGIRSKRRSS